MFKIGDRVRQIDIEEIKRNYNVIDMMTYYKVYSKDCPSIEVTWLPKVYYHKDLIIKDIKDIIQEGKRRTIFRFEGKPSIWRYPEFYELCNDEEYVIGDISDLI